MRRTAAALLLLLTIAIPCAAADLPPAPIKALSLVLPEQATPLMNNVALIASQRILARIDKPAPDAESEEHPYTITFSLNPALPSEAFAITDAPHGITIAGHNELAVLYGVGKFLHTSQFTGGGLIPSAWRGQSAPEGSFRAIYAATHFNNFYEAAPINEIARYLEDLALWGANAVIVHFPTWAYPEFKDNDALENIKHTREILRAAKAIGLKTGLIQCPNQGFTTAPENVRSDLAKYSLQGRSDMGVNCCPSTPEGKAYLLDLYKRLFGGYSDIGLDYFISWPYDEGGCPCDLCAPWGAKAFPQLTKDIAELARKSHPNLKVILSTWLYDYQPAGEWEGLAAGLGEDHAWLDAIMADSHTDFPRYPLEHGVPANKPLYNFPEISMWGRHPWGAYGANPLPARYERLWKQTNGKLTGGMPYSEGIFEDINKVICFQFYWKGDIPAEETLRQYAAYEYAPEVADDVVNAVRLLEATWEKRGPQSEENFQLLQKIDSALPERMKTQWRWRILYLRGLIDSTLAANGEKLEGPELKAAFDELTTIYHAQEAGASVKPPQITLPQ
jgi:hypothetical protein